MEQNWNCPHCGKPIGKIDLLPPAAANPLTPTWKLTGTNDAGVQILGRKT